jgi:hypothetical protein
MTVYELATRLLECDKPDTDVVVDVEGWSPGKLGIIDVSFNDAFGPVKIEVGGHVGSQDGPVGVNDDRR